MIIRCVGSILPNELREHQAHGIDGQEEQDEGPQQRPHTRKQTCRSKHSASNMPPTSLMQASGIIGKEAAHSNDLLPL
eukprot:3977051-Amphidinium_carterae.1